MEVNQVFELSLVPHWGRIMTSLLLEVNGGKPPKPSLKYLSNASSQAEFEPGLLPYC